LLIVGTPAVLSIGHSGAEAFLIAVVYRLPQQVSAILIGFVVRAAAVVAIDWRGVEIRIVVVIVTLFAQTSFLLTQTLYILFLEAVLRHPPLLL